MIPQTDHDWQLVLVLWGTKYPIGEVNHLIRSVRGHASRPPRVVMITDRPREGLEEGVIQRPFPDFFIQDEMKRSGCQAKLCMFEQGVIPDDLPSVFIDIDTVVFGDMSRFLSLQYDRKTVAIFQSAVLPFGAFASWIYRVTKGKKYARGNSSIIVFHPAECHHIAARYRELYAQHGFNGIRPMVADERFISWSNQPNMRAIPSDMAVKMPTEFMLPWRWLILLRARLPWVRARWSRLIAVTLPGIEVKGEALLALPEGGEIIDRKGRRLIWSERALGPVKEKLSNYYKALIQMRGQE